MTKSLDAIVIGSGPIASLVAGSLNLEKYNTALMCFLNDLINGVREHGLYIENHKEKVVPYLPEGILHEKTIKPSEILLNSNHLEQHKLHFYTSSLPPDTIPISNNVVIFFATKTYDNTNNLKQIEPILREAKSPVIVSFQNGTMPEIKISNWLKENGLENLEARVVRAVPQGPCTVIGPGKLRNGIYIGDLGHWDAEKYNARKHAYLCRKISGMFDSLNCKNSGKKYKTKSAEKTLVNLINTLAVAFAINTEEAITSSFIKELYLVKFHEGIEVFNSICLDINPLKSLIKAYKMFDTNREHLPSMGRDPYVILREGKNSQFLLNTETLELEGDIVNLGLEHGRIAYWNSLFSELVNDVCNSFNEIKKKDYEIAAEFLIRFQTRNRHIIGLEPYVLKERYGNEFKVLKRLEPKVKKSYSDIDGKLEKASYLCERGYGSGMRSLSKLLIDSYIALKSQYLNYLPNPSFELSIKSCPEAKSCVARCYSKIAF